MIGLLIGKKSKRISYVIKLFNTIWVRFEIDKNLSADDIPLPACLTAYQFLNSTFSKYNIYHACHDPK